MCGIVGISNSKSAQANAPIADAMAQAIARRGPDAAGLQILGSSVFAHRRLSIIDLDKRSDQPMCSSENDCMITFNGEIYNYRILRAELAAQGCEFKTSGDTEVILKLYQHGGADALKKLDGMFAFAIYDKRNNTLLLMRDRLGKKPLYYFVSDHNEVVFASTLQALKKHPLFPLELKDEAIADFLSYSCVPGSQTIYKDVYKLPPATMMICQLDSSKAFRTIRYWDLDYSGKLDISFDEAAVMLQDKLQKAVERRLIADVPCGIFLSGGVDSAAIAMLAARVSDETLSAFTIGFNESKYDESFLAALTVKHINSINPGKLQHSTRIVDCSSFENLKALAAGCGEPFADLSLLPTAALSEFASEKVKFVLSGDGGDELFGGYERYAAMKYCAILDKTMPRPVMRLLSATANRLLPDAGKRSRYSRLSRFLRLAAAPESTRYVQMTSQMTENMQRRLFGERLQPTVGKFSENITNALNSVTSHDNIEQYAECDLHTYLVDDILVKVDRASMYHSLEARSPFLDREIVEFAASLPFEFKLKGCDRKRVLKRAVRDLIPPEVADGRKRGFAIPLGQWLRSEWHTPVWSHLLEGKLTNNGLIDKTALEAMLAAHDSFKHDNSELIGNLLMLELFLEEN